MTSPPSPIYQYYPADFETDLNGKRNDWEAAVLLYFVQTGLPAALHPVPSSQITAEEKKRNKLGFAFF